MAKFNLRRLSSADRNFKKQENGSEKIRGMLSEVLSFTNTSQVDFDKFTPDTLVEIAKYEIANAERIQLDTKHSINFISNMENKPHITRRYSCCM